MHCRLDVWLSIEWRSHHDNLFEWNRYCPVTEEDISRFLLDYLLISNRLPSFGLCRGAHTNERRI